MSSRIELLQTLFDDVCRAAPEDRHRLARERCANDPELLASLMQLIEADARAAADPWFTRPIAPQTAAECLGIADDQVPHPDSVGGYRIIRAIGAGAFGVVYLGERDEPFHQRVAIKIIKPGMDTRSVLSRFAKERNTLALLDHPGVVRILDAGRTLENHPYFVMEFVDGLPISEHCAKSNLGLDETIRVFRGVCEAIQFAHQKGVIHRDLKPQNVLVTNKAETPIAKVIDFGVSRVLAGDSPASETIGPEIAIGTPQYMSPEQARSGQREIDTRTDVYGLAAILYELLTGRAPIDPALLVGRTTPERLAIVASSTPDPPSKLRDSGLCPARFVWPGEPRARLKELDWIVMRGLRHEPDERYQSVGELAADLQCLLDRRPVSAGPDRGWYQIRKFAQRHAMPLSVLALIIIALAALIAQQVWSVRNERHLRKDADAARDRAEALALDLRKAQDSLRRKAAEAELAAAVAHLETGNAVDAQFRLNQVPQDLRAWEWRLLWSRTEQSAATVKVSDGHADSLSVRFDGHRLAATGSNQDVSILDTPTMTVVDRIGGFGDRRSMNCAYLEADRSLIVADFSGTYRVLDDQTHQERRRFRGPPVGRMSVTGDGRRLLIQDRKLNNAVLIDYATGSELLRVGQDVKHVVPLEPKGHFLTAGDGFLRLYDDLGNCTRSVHAGDGLSEIAVSHSGRFIAVTEGAGVVVCDAATLQRVAFLTVAHSVRSVQWGASDEFLLTAGLDSALRVWDWPAQRLRTPLLSPEASHSTLRASPDGRAWYSGSFVGHVRRWPAPTDHHAVVAELQADCIDCSSDGRSIVLASWKSPKAIVLRCDDLAVVGRHQSPVGPCAVVCGSDGDSAYLGGTKGLCRLNLVSGRAAVLVESTSNPRGVRLARSADRRMIAYGHDDGRNLWLVGQDDAVREISADRPLGSPLALSRDGRVVVSGWNNVINILDAHTGEIRSFEEDDSEIACAAAVSSDRRLLASAAWGRPMHVRSIETGEAIATYDCRESILSMSFVDDDRLVACDVAGYLRVWDGGTLEPVVTLHSQASWLRHAEGPDGSLLFIQLEGSIRRWLVDRR